MPKTYKLVRHTKKITIPIDIDVKIAFKLAFLADTLGMSIDEIIEDSLRHVYAEDFMDDTLPF